MFRKLTALLLIAVLALLAFPIVGHAAETTDTADEMIEEQLEESGYYSLFSLLPPEAEGSIADGFEPEDLDSLTLPGLLEKGWEMVRQKGTAPLRLLACMLGVTVLSALLGSFSKSPACRPVTTLVLAVLLAETVVSAVRSTAALVKGLSAFMLSFLPVFAASAAAAGKPASSVIWYGTTLSAIEIFSAAVDGLVVPLMMIFLGLSFAGVAAPDLHAGALIRSVRSLALWILSLCLTIFLALLTIKTRISGVSDGVTLKTAKFLLSSAVPVVGSAVGDAWSAMSGCLTLVKSTIGVFGILVLAVVFLPQLIYLGLLTAALNLGAAAADTLSEGGPAEVMRVSSAAVSIMLSVLICYAVMILGALAMVLLAGS